MKFKAVKTAQILSGLYILVVTFTYEGNLGYYGGATDPATGFIIDPTSNDYTADGVLMWNGDLRAVVAETNLQMVLLGLSRFSGFFMYPCLILVFLTKLRATGAFLCGTLFNLFMYQDMHRLHVYCGWVILFDSCIHTICHLSRWLLQGNLNLLFQHNSGITGLVIVISTFFICLPMMVYREKIKYEIRKLAHYLFLVFAAALCFHAPKSAVPNAGFCAYIFPTILAWYALDCLYCALFMTELIETTKFHSLPSGVQMTMKVSKRFQSWGNSGGYAYVCFPWVDRHQWHAFSLFENPKNPEEERQIFMQRTGDWTNRVHELLERDSVRPIWIMGPFPSPYKNAIKYDNQILVAGGIGITPALSVICAHKEHRCINLIWAVRDPAMLQFYLEHALLDSRGWNLIFYTGKEPLASSLIDGVASTNVCIINGRPNLDDLIPNIVYGFETGKGRPERYLPNKKAEAINQLRERLDQLDATSNMTPMQKICDLAKHAESLGYIFYDLVSGLEKVNADDSGVSSKKTRTASIVSMDTLATASSGIDLCDDETEGELDCGELGTNGAALDTSRTRESSGDFQVLKKLRKYTFYEHVDLSDDSGSEHQESQMVDGKKQPPQPSILRGQWEGFMNDMTQTFKPWEPHPEAVEYVSELDPIKVKSTWGILYCGGQGKLLSNLKRASKAANLKLYEESFAW